MLEETNYECSFEIGILCIKSLIDIPNSFIFFNSVASDISCFARDALFVLTPSPFPKKKYMAIFMHFTFCKYTQ